MDGGASGGRPTATRTTFEKDGAAIGEFLAGLPVKRLNYCIWDLAPARDPRELAARLGEGEALEIATYEKAAALDFLEGVLRKAPEIFMAGEGREILALAWTRPLTGESPAANIHFMTKKDRRVRRFFGEIVRDVLRLTEAPALCGLIPARYATETMAADLARAGFEIMATIPAACHLARWDRIVDGLFCYWARAKKNRPRGEDGQGREAPGQGQRRPAR